MAELYVHINDHEIERDAQVIRSDVFYSFALAHTFEDFLLFPPNFPVFTLLSSSHWKFVGSYDNKLLFIVSRWYKELFIVKIYKILKGRNVLVIILQYIEKNKLIIVSNCLSFQNLFCENTFKECLFYFIFKI